MTVTIGTKALNVEGGGLSESTEVVGSYVDRWINGSYAKEAKIYGIIRRWTLRCYEQNVAWSGSAAKYLQDKAKEGEKLSFAVDEGDMHSVGSTYVYILDVDVEYPKGSKNTQFTRRFTVQLQEAPNG